MRSILKTLFILVFLSALVACGSSSKEERSTITDKKVQLEKLKGDQKKIADEIIKLETEIAKEDPNASGARPKLVTVVALGTSDFTHAIEMQGQVDAENIAYVTPRGMGGQVQAVYVREGQYVKKGQLLMKLDDATARLQASQVQTQLDHARDLYGRQKNLWDQGIGTEVQVLTAKNNVQSLERQLAIAREQVSYSNVYAGISGVVDEVKVRVGELFTAQSAAMSGIRIVNTSGMKLTTTIPENYVSRVKQGAPVEIVVPDMNNRIISSKVTRISQSIDPNSRGFQVEASLPAGSGLKPNQIAIMKIRDYSAPDAIVIPLGTIQTDEKGKFVFVMVTEKGKQVARKKQVVPGEIYGENLEVRQGLVQGDKLITAGFQGLYDGQLITTLAD